MNIMLTVQSSTSHPYCSPLSYFLIEYFSVGFVQINFNEMPFKETPTEKEQMLY